MSGIPYFGDLSPVSLATLTQGNPSTVPSLECGSTVHNVHLACVTPASLFQRFPSQADSLAPETCGFRLHLLLRLLFLDLNSLGGSWLLSTQRQIWQSSQSLKQAQALPGLQYFPLTSIPPTDQSQFSTLHPSHFAVCPHNTAAIYIPTLPPTILETSDELETA